jgi:hypothetical protein
MKIALFCLHFLHRMANFVDTKDTDVYRLLLHFRGAPIVVKILHSIAAKLITGGIFVGSLVLISQGLGFLCQMDRMPLSEDSSVPAGHDLSYWDNVRATPMPLPPEALKKLSYSTHQSKPQAADASSTTKPITVPVDGRMTQTSNHTVELP